MCPCGGTLRPSPLAYSVGIRNRTQLPLGCTTSVTGQTRVTIKTIAAPGTWSVDPIGGIMKDGSTVRPNPNEKLVRVFDTEQESEALVVHGLLQASEIDSDVTSLDAQQDILPGVGGTIILVREEDADRARRVIEEYRQAPGSDETAEIDISGIPED